ncbi:type II secretion system protein [Poriferisphaera sp. WC338]|uniref:type II secretion system protein n=1 Tax=Poriferisphaera sp. WC338 TaxID=3425129 RepID=UPI003D815BC2
MLTKFVMRTSHKHAFTLVELMIVVVILGVLAAIVIPQFSTAASEASENALKANLRNVRQQIVLYKQEHNGYPTLANFSDQLLLLSTKDGSTAAVGTSGYPLGPYLQKIPKNPYTGNNSVGDGAIGSSDWYYDESTGDFAANDHADRADY